MILRWSLIAGRIPWRTDKEIKNYWNTHLSKKLISQGIDPRNHKPLNLSPNPTEIVHDYRASISNQNPNRGPNSPGGNSLQANAFQSDHTNLEQCDHNLAVNDGVIAGNEEDYIENCNEDTFSSFLDSLINDNMFVNQQQPNFQQTFMNHSTIWETEVRSTIDASCDDQQSALNNHLAWSWSWSDAYRTIYIYICMDLIVILAFDVVMSFFLIVHNSVVRKRYSF